MVHRERMVLGKVSDDRVMEELFSRKMIALMMGGKPIDH